MKKWTLLLFFFTVLIANNSFAQKDIWQKLSAITWEDKYSEVYEMDLAFPVFSDEAKNLEGKEVIVKGYLLPVETEDGSFVISSLPYSSCFFCGGAGAETVMAVFLKKPMKFELEMFTFKGKLKLNDGENGLIYNLMEAEEYKGDL